MRNQYLVGKDKNIIFKTESRELLNKFTALLCDEYEENLKGSHEVFIKNGDEYLYSHATWFSGNGGVASRGCSPMPNQTERVLREYCHDNKYCTSN